MQHLGCQAGASLRERYCLNSRACGSLTPPLCQSAVPFLREHARHRVWRFSTGGPGCLLNCCMYYTTCMCDTTCRVLESFSVTSSWLQRRAQMLGSESGDVSLNGRIRTVLGL